MMMEEKSSRFKFWPSFLFLFFPLRYTDMAFSLSRSFSFLIITYSLTLFLQSLSLSLKKKRNNNNKEGKHIAMKNPLPPLKKKKEINLKINRNHPPFLLGNGKEGCSELWKQKERGGREYWFDSLIGKCFHAWPYDQTHGRITYTYTLFTLSFYLILLLYTLCNRIYDSHFVHINKFNIASFQKKTNLILQIN